MVVQVVAAQVAEHRGVHLHRLAPALVQGVGRHLHGQVIDAAVYAVSEYAVERQGVRGGVRGRLEGIESAVAQRSDQPRAAVDLLPDLGQEMGDGSLAVGSGDRGDGHLLRRRGPESGSQFAEPARQLLEHHHGHVHIIVIEPAVVDDGHATIGNGLFRMLHSMAAGALHGNECKAGLDLPGIQADPGNEDFRHIGQPTFEQCPQAHAVGHGVTSRPVPAAVARASE